MKQQECKFCHKPILWIRTAKNGKPMPVDPFPKPTWPSKSGSHIAVLPDGRVLRADFEDNGHPYAGIGYTSHYATCDNRKVIQLNQEAAEREKKKIEEASPEQTLF